MDTQFTPRPDNEYLTKLVSTTTPPDSAVAWCAVFAGAAASAALSLILLLLGTGFGLSLVSPWSSEGISGTAFGLSSIAGITIISLLASAMGGYLAGRLRTRWTNTPTDEVYFRDTAHGFLSWSVATLATAALLTGVTGAIISGGIKAGADVVGGAATAIATANSGDENDAPGMSNMPLPYFLDSLLRKEPGVPVNAEQPPLNLENPQDPAVANAPAPIPAADERQSTLQRNAAKGELTQIFINAVAMDSLPENDAQYAGQLVAQTTGLNQQAAEQRVLDTFAALQTKLQEAETSAREAADKARKISARTSLWLFISLLSGAFIASLMAIYGGRQRDL